VLLAEGHWAMRAGLRAALGGDDGVEVVGEAGDAHETVRRVAELAPDVVLLSMNLPGGDVLNVARLISQSAAVRVLLLAEPHSGVAVRQVIEAGCTGLLCSTLSKQELLEALRCVHAGRVYLDADAARELAQPAKAPMACPVERLSPRERAVFLFVADGHTNRSMGDSLGLSTKTVEKHRAAVMTKLRMGSALDLRIKALDLKLCGRTPSASGQAPEGDEPVCAHAGCPEWCGADFRATPQSRTQGD
jgi:DNA-binding NarL/FixJ family response regulator